LTRGGIRKGGQKSRTAGGKKGTIPTRNKGRESQERGREKWEAKLYIKKKKDEPKNPLKGKKWC